MKVPHTKTLGKLINLVGNKKYVFVNGDTGQQARKGNHQKANTQNINIYNIIHNECKLESQTQDTHQPRPNKFERTYDQPLRIPRVHPKTKHDLALYQELQSYKIEVEERFNSSTANGVYKFPLKPNDIGSKLDVEEDYIVDAKNMCIN